MLFWRNVKALFMFVSLLFVQFPHFLYEWIAASPVFMIALISETPTLDRLKVVCPANSIILLRIAFKFSGRLKYLLSLFLSRHSDFFTLDFLVSLCLSSSAAGFQSFSDSYWWIITKLGLWVGITALLDPFYCRSGWMHTWGWPIFKLFLAVFHPSFSLIFSRISSFQKLPRNSELERI